MSMRGKITKAFFLFFIAMAIVLPAKMAIAGSIVQSIEIQGNTRTPADTIKGQIKSQAGAPLSAETVDADIKALYALGQFRDIRVESEPAAGGVKLIYIVEEKPLIAEIGFSGNKKLKSDDLKAEVVQHTFSALDERAVAESMEKIRQAYAKKGYYLAAVDYHVESTADGGTKLVFDIHENQGVAVRKVMFIGNKVYKDKQLRSIIRTKEKTAFSFMTGSGKYEEEMLKNDALMLMYHYMNNGYLKVRISPAKVTISKDKRYIYITFQVHEGSQYRMGKISVSGDILTTSEEIKSLIKTRQGDIYSQRTLDGDVMAITEEYGDQGYAYATISPQIVPDDETLTADLDIQITKGKKITIERINIDGNSTTRDKVIRRELELMENDRYNETALKKSREKLMRLGFFEEVNFATPRGSSDDKMILNITVKEKATGSFNISAGFSTFEHFIFNASVQKDNFFGYGVGGSISAELSRKRQLFMLSLNDPYFLDTKWSAGFSVYRSGFFYTDFKRQSTGGDVNFGHRFFDHYMAQLGYQLEKVDVTDFSFAVPQVFRQNTSGTTSALNLTLERDTRDNRIVPNKGLYNVLLQEVSGAKLGGSNDFYRVNFRTMFYQPIYKTVIFKTFGKIGYIKSLNNFMVPLFERYFAGGPNNLRGYYANSVGPTLRIPTTPAGSVADFVYGGNKILLFVTELEAPIYDKAGLRAVAFFDAGNAYAENQNYSFSNIRLDYGFGVRWNSPMGPLRFEWGFPINRQPGEQPVQFNFTIGNFF